MRAIGSNAARNKRIRGVRSFEIRKNSDRSVWWLRVNRTHLIGLFPTQADAVSALYGVFTHNDAEDGAVALVIADQIARGISVIDPDINILSIAEADPEVTITAEAIDYAAAIEGEPDVSGGVYLATQTSTDGVTWTTPGVGDVVGAALTAGDDGTTISRTTSDGRWTNTAENDLIRPVIFAFDGSLVAHVLVTGTGLRKDDVNDLTLTLEISGESTAGASVEIGGFAYAIPTVGGVPEGQSSSLTYAWSREIPLLDGLSAQEL